MNSLVINRAVAEDTEQLLPLLESLFSLEKDFEFDPEKARRALVQLINDSSRSCVLVARVGNRVAGMCSAQLVVSTAQGTPSAWVEDVVVAREYRRHGIGDTLLSELEHWCREQGATRMQLVADCDNQPALAFYRVAGWSDTNLKVIKRHLKT